MRLHSSHRTVLAIAAMLGGLALANPPPAAADARSRAPTVVLVHGAFAESSSWNGVLPLLERDGYHLIAAAVPLRGVHSDARYVADLIRGIEGPIVLVGHSYGGAVISEAAVGNPLVKALVYVAAFAPDTGETAAGLSGKFPGSTLGPTLAPPVALSGGGNDLYIQQTLFHAQFAADVSAAEARVMAATQRPISDIALNEAAIEPAWRTTPSWFIYGEKDNNIPAQTLRFMADRAKGRRIQMIKGASHVVMVSHPKEVAQMIREAATAVVSASP
jgi:pimeloyl-ACP methyl ester carboxylesterase